MSIVEAIVHDKVPRKCIFRKYTTPPITKRDLLKFARITSYVPNRDVIWLINFGPRYLQTETHVFNA